MLRKFFCSATLLGCLLLVGVSAVEGRTLDGIRPSNDQPNATAPAYCNTYHNVGRIALEVSNDGTFGTLGLSVSSSQRDCFTNETLPNCEFPKGSRTTYCFGAALWIGAVVGRDTLVSTAADGWARPGNEFHPDEAPFGSMIYRSTIDPARPEFEGAISEQDYIGVYADTCTNCTGVSPNPDGRPHIPLNIEVTQRTFAWSYAYAQDFVLFDYAIKNIGTERMRRLFMGFYVDADIHDNAIQDGGAQDDFCGFREYQPALYLGDNCVPDSDQVNIAWTADNDAEFGQVAFQTTPHITATRIVRTPSDSLEVSFNWWVSNSDPSLDFGPMARANQRDFGTGGSGTPEGDRNKFFILSNGEFDFDQPRAATIAALDSVWLPVPPDRAPIWATGLDTRYVLSFGPFDVEPGQTLPISLAYVAGANFHLSEDNFANLPNNPDSWYEGVNFDSLGSNATWADWVYDNPGVDTDSDGYAGEYTVCNLGGDSTFVCDTTWDSSVTPPAITETVCYWDFEHADTIWRKGDGVPDFRGASPPPRPILHTVETRVGSVRMIWNGAMTENTQDVFSREIDFEGYRIWVGRDDRRSSFSLLASYDIEDFNRWDYSAVSGDFVLNESPFTLVQLRCMYADSCTDTTWHPLDFPRHRPLVIDQGPSEDPLIYYFEPQDHNQSILANEPNFTTPIKKIYPNAPHPPVLEPDSIRILFPNGLDTLYLTDNGFVKYYEYEYTLEGLLPTVPYWLNVTAFDYGSPKSGLEALETNPTIEPKVVYPLEAPNPTNLLGSSEVFVWPNPYRRDGEYRERGLEDFGANDIPGDRVRAIHFANLPDRCTIRIYSIDGDLVRKLSHPANFYPDGSCPYTEHEACWDLITRNTQQVVSGLYYWTVEDEAGNIQIGKLVVIM